MIKHSFFTDFWCVGWINIIAYFRYWTWTLVSLAYQQLHPAVSSGMTRKLGTKVLTP